MQNLFTNKTIAVGLEPECVGVSPNQMNAYNTRSNLINGLSYKSDPSVGTEADLPVLADCQFTRDYMDRVYAQIQSQGGRVNVKCSTHIHLSTMPIKAGLTNEEFSRRSTEMRQSDRNYLLDQNKLNQLFDTNTSSRIPLEVMKDILYRVSKHIDFFHSCFAKSRRDDGGFCRSANRPNGYWSRKPASVTQILNARVTQHDLERVQNHTNGTRKYSAVNLQHYNTKKTVEFRSHGGTLEIDKIWSWIQFLINMTRHSINARHSQVQSVIDTPDYIGRSYRTRQSIAYQLMRRVGGATTQEIMDATGIQTAQRVRSMISEQIRPVLRQRFGRDILITHNQQHYNHAYSTSQGRYDLNGYEIPLQVNNASGGCVFANNGRTDLLSGLIDQHKRHLKPFRN